MIKRNGDWLSARVGDEIMMMSVEKGQYLGLNAVGARIWELLEEPREKSAICRALETEFEVDAAACEREVAAFMAELEAHGAITTCAS